jgi:ABC-type amino acid transport substrate-binding protein
MTRKTVFRAGHYARRLRLTSTVLGSLLAGASIAGPDLSGDDHAYLKAHPDLRLCVDPDWPPYEWLEQSDRHRGLVAAYMELFQERLGVSFRPVPVATWTETQRLYSKGECDIVSALNENDARAEYLNFTPPFLSSPAILVVRDGNRDVQSLADLAGRKLGMVPGYIYESKLRADHPDIELVEVTTMREGLNQVASEELDATLGPLFLVAYSINRLGLDNLTILGSTEYRDELRVGVRKGDAQLHSILTKLVSDLTPEDHARMRRIWRDVGTTDRP